jgi:DNA-binding protein HU-beta
VNKKELVDAIAKDSGLTATDARKAVDSFTTVVTKQLKKGDEVALTGFGKFSITKRAARKGVNPATGEPIRIRASKTPRFTAGASLKTSVAGRRKSS